ncbi:MAG: fatty acid desaturase [Rhodobacter sp.]|nr:fatty acid desaturase [Rhodobacter sp.]
MSVAYDTDIREYLKDWTAKDDRIGALSFFGSYAAFLLVFFATVLIVASPYWWAAPPFILVSAFAGVRLYVLQHDCGHHSLFSRRWMNEWAGYALSPITLAPFRAMQYNHNMHHAYLGNLDHRETTEIHTMTLREWNEAGPWRRLGYRLYRNPFFLMPIGGVFVFFFHYRWPKNTLKIGVPGVLAHNAMLAGWIFLLYLLFGWVGPITLAVVAVVCAVIGVFLVYLQHNFEDAYWDRKPDLDYKQAALQGSSALDLGHWWDIGTGNIAYHDIHHYNPSIPSYALRKCHHGLPAKYSPRRVTWRQAIASLRLKLWDEDQARLVPFPKQAEPAAVPAE